VVEPDGRRLARDVEDHLQAGLVHLLEDVVEPRELELAVGRLEGVPREVAHPHERESRGLHQRDVPADLLGRSVDRLIAGADEELALAGPARLRFPRLGVRGGRDSEESHGEEPHSHPEENAHLDLACRRGPARHRSALPQGESAAARCVSLAGGGECPTKPQAGSGLPVSPALGQRRERSAARSRGGSGLNLSGGKPAGPARLWQITAASLEEANRVGQPAEVELKESQVVADGTLSVAPTREAASPRSARLSRGPISRRRARSLRPAPGSTPSARSAAHVR
jgi:hypothetical protein